MERHMGQVSLTWLKIKWPKLNFVKKPVNIRMILALQEAEKRMDKVRLVLDERIRLGSLR